MGDDGVEEIDEEDSDDAAASPAVIATPSTSAKKKRNKRKKKTAAPAESDPAESTSTPAKTQKKVELDEIDRALQELGIKPNTASSASVAAPTLSGRTATSSAVSILRSLLAVDSKHLDADAELTRMFGRSVVNAARGADMSANPAANRARHNAARHRTILAKPLAHWAPIGSSRSGVTMEVASADVHQPGNENWYTYQHSNGYKELQRAFILAVQSSDVNGLMALLHQYPYHYDTLLQLAEIANQQGDAGMSDNYLEQALFAYEKAFAPGFSLPNGTGRLAFEKIENRGLWRALDRKVTSLTKRGCWRTSFETAKVLLQLDPYADPYGALLQ